MHVWHVNLNSNSSQGGLNEVLILNLQSLCSPMYAHREGEIDVNWSRSVVKERWTQELWDIPMVSYAFTVLPLPPPCPLSLRCPPPRSHQQPTMWVLLDRWLRWPWSKGLVEGWIHHVRFVVKVNLWGFCQFFPSGNTIQHFQSAQDRLATSKKALPKIRWIRFHSSILRTSKRTFMTSLSVIGI